MINELYKDYILPENEKIPDFDITFGINVD